MRQGRDTPISSHTCGNNSAARRVESIVAQIDTRQRPDQVGAAISNAGVQGGRVSALVLLDHIQEIFLIDVEPLVALDATAIHGVLVLGIERHEFVVPIELRKRDGLLRETT